MTEQRDKPAGGRARRPAHFVYQHRSSVLHEKVTWRITTTTSGVVAVRTRDHHRLAITWREVIGLAMFYGRGAIEEGGGR